MSTAQIWLIAAILLFILEIATPGFVLANFGVAAIAASVTAWLGGGTTTQVIVFVVVCLISFVTVRPVLARTIGKHRHTRTGVDALIGRVTKVTEDIEAPPDTGRVQVDGDSWRAVSIDQQPVPSGTTVRIVRVDGTTLHVERM